MGGTLAGIQPGYLPWLGFFDMMSQADVFLVADELAFSSSGWAHRNRVRGPEGANWLTLPARPAPNQPIVEVPLDADSPWARKHMKSLRHFYRRSSHAAEILDRLESVLDPRAARIVDVSVPVLRAMAELLGIDTPILISSELALEAGYRQRFPEQPSPTHRIVSYMEALGADRLIEGATGRSYLDVDLCSHHGIDVVFHDYDHPIYTQLHQPFISHLSAIDLLLCEGVAGTREVIQQRPARAAS